MKKSVSEITIDLNFQRAGALSNAHVGRDFEEKAKIILADQGIAVSENFPVSIGVGAREKIHKFDLGCESKKVLVECKSHKWTSGDKVPSAKLTVWNEAMYYFYLAPPDYRMIMFVLKDISRKRDLSLADYYIQKYIHLIPDNVEFWEFDEDNNKVEIKTIH